MLPAQRNPCGCVDLTAMFELADVMRLDVVRRSADSAAVAGGCEHSVPEALLRCSAPSDLAVGAAATGWDQPSALDARAKRHVSDGRTPLAPFSARSPPPPPVRRPAAQSGGRRPSSSSAARTQNDPIHTSAPRPFAAVVAVLIAEEINPLVGVCPRLDPGPLTANSPRQSVRPLGAALPPATGLLPGAAEYWGGTRALGERLHGRAVARPLARQRPMNDDTRIIMRVSEHRYRDSNPGFRTENPAS